MSDHVKIDRLERLRRERVIQEECPERDYWRFSVLQIAKLPLEFVEEYARLGELRWYGGEK